MLQNFADLEDAAGSEAKLWLLIGKDFAMSLGSQFSGSRLGRYVSGFSMALVLLFAIGYALRGPTTAHAKDWSKLAIAGSLNFMPYAGRNASGWPIGFDIDVTNNLCARMRATCTIEDHYPMSLATDLNAGKYDAVIGALSIPPKRSEEVDFSRAYALPPFTFAVQKNDPLADMPSTRVSLDDVPATEAMVKELTPYLTGKKIGVRHWSVQEDLLNTYFKGITAQTRTTREAILKVQTGQLDAALSFTSFFVSALAEPGGDRLTLAGPQMTGGPLGRGLGIALRKTDPELKDRFDKAIREAQADGTLKRLSLKWFKTDISPPN